MCFLRAKNLRKKFIGKKDEKINQFQIDVPRKLVLFA